jgi:molybdenum cofactor cytidylyltransferase
MTQKWITGVVLAAGASRRLGRPKQVLPYRDTTLLGATLDLARGVGFDQLIVTLGGAAREVRDAVPLDGVDVVALDELGADFGSGCSASLRVALRQVDPQAAGIVLMVGDQPRLDPATLRRIVTDGPAADITVCRYADGLGHPFWFSRNMFDELSQLRGDKGVWKLLHAGRHPLREIAVDGPAPLDVDTWEDYRRLIESVSS